MFLKRFVYVNWGNIPNGALEFGPISLFSGESGSGKTTAADAIQTLFTAAKKGLFQFNPGQDEVTQQSHKKESRTLASYVMGCDENAYARLQMTDCYIAGVFAPHAGEDAQTFTAVISVRAFLEKENHKKVAKEDKVSWFFVLDEELHMDDFVETVANTQNTIASNLIISVLSKKYGQEKVLVAQNRKHYLSKLYGSLRGSAVGVSDLESHSAAKAFSSIMAYKPVTDLNSFVKEQVLERRDLGKAIKNISGAMKSIHHLEQDAKKIKISIAKLGDIQTNVLDYVIAYLELQTLNKLYSQDRRDKVQKLLVANKKNQTLNREQLTENLNKIAQLQDLMRTLLDKKVMIQAKRQGCDVLNEKDTLQKEISQAERDIIKLVGVLLSKVSGVEKFFGQLSKLLQQIDFDEFGKDSILGQDKVSLLLTKLSKVSFDAKAIVTYLQSADLLDTHQEMSSLLAPLETSLGLISDFWQTVNACYEEGSGLSPLDIELYKLKQKLTQLKSNYNELEVDVARLNTFKKIKYPGSVQKTLDIIKESIKDANPCVLCDVVEVLDEKWQNAIEGFLGQNRYMILVDPEAESEVIRHLAKLKGIQVAKVAQGSRSLDKVKNGMDIKKSIVSVLKVDHFVANAFLQASYGNVMLIDDIDELKSAVRGLTQSGMAANNFTLFNCSISDEELVFGKGAREAISTAKVKELEKISKQIQKVEANIEALESFKLLLVSAQGLGLNTELVELSENISTLTKKKSLVSVIDTSAFESLETAYQAIEVEYQSHEKIMEGYQVKVGELENAYQVLQKEFHKLAGDVDKLNTEVELNEANYTQAASIWPLEVQPDFNVSALKQYPKLVEELNVRLTKDRRLISQGCFEHNQSGTQFDTLTTDITHYEESFSVFGGICQLAKEIDQILRRLQNNVLLQKISQLEELYQSFETTFVTDLSVQIYDAIRQGERRLKDLNKELTKHRFGSETYEFAWDFVPEFKEYFNFFKEIIEIPHLGAKGGLFQNAVLSTKSQAVGKRILEMLLCDDEAKSLFELDRITDYRQYRQYEIFKKPEGKDPIPLSKYGSGSGGQLETPAYVIRAASFMSAMRFQEPGSHCRFIIMDESFSKMDEQRSKQVIHYLTEVLGLQIIFIMPSSKSGPFKSLLSNEVTFTKAKSTRMIGELNTQVFVQQKIYNQEKVKALFEAHKAKVTKSAQIDFLKLFEDELSD